MRHSTAWPRNWMSFWREGQLLAGGDANLLLHDVDAGDHFGDRVLDLHAGVHFDEVELVVFVQKLERARTAIADLAAGLGTTLADLVAQLGVEMRGRCFFDDLLVAALHGAIALAQIHGIAVLVGQHLDLDMARVLQKLLHVHHGIVEGSLRFGLGHGHRVEQRRFGMHHAHAASAAAAGGLDDDRVADELGDSHDLGRIVRQRAFHAGHAGHAGLFHGVLGGNLVAHQADGFGARADEHETGFFARARRSRRSPTGSRNRGEWLARRSLPPR